MTGVEKNKKESIKIISKSEIHSWKNFLKFKQFICTECIVQELIMPLNISPLNFVSFLKEQNQCWRRLRAYVKIYCTRVTYAACFFPNSSNFPEPLYKEKYE